MGSVTRQENLFAAESWKVAYKAYQNISYQAYDYDTIRAALVEYVKINFPENFNDYIESSEFIAIIELLAYLSQSLAFRMDINTRENFLETAESLKFSMEEPGWRIDSERRVRRWSTFRSC